jgi:hypothetical protein
MGTDTMGRVLTEARIENLQDVWDAERGILPDSQVRRFELKDALVDTGATLLSLPIRMIKQLGLVKFSFKTNHKQQGGRPGGYLRGCSTDDPGSIVHDGRHGGAG